jgi:hypothetical protein
MSKIFSWYAKDFGSKEDMVRMFLKYLPSNERQQLERMLASTSATTLRFEYKPYDWGQNSR